MGVNLHDFGLDKDFLIMHQNHKQQKKTQISWSSLKLKTLAQREPSKKWKGNHQKSEKVTHRRGSNIYKSYNW